MTDRFQIRRGSTSAWQGANPVLADGEPGLDETLNGVKWGDGSTAWGSKDFQRDPGAVHYTGDTPTTGQIAAVLAMLGAATDTAVVHNSGPETVAGVKTFANPPTVPTPSGTGDAANKGYVDTAVGAKATDSAVVHLAGTETITGTKTFSAAPTVPTPTANGHAATKLYVDGHASGTANVYTTLGYYNAGLTATTQAGATANSNAIAIANTTALQAAHDNCPLNTAIFLPAVDGGADLAYFLASPVRWTRQVHLVGGNPAQMDLSNTSDGGATLRDIPGFNGVALIIRDSCDHANVYGVQFVANTTKTCVLDNGVSATWANCAWYGGTEAAYDSRNGVNAPYNLTMTGQGGAGQGGKRNNLSNCQGSATNSAIGTYNSYWGTDYVITGGRYTSGTKCFNGSGAILTGSHLTGGAPLLDIQSGAVRNTIVGCQFDAATGIAMIRLNAGQCQFGNILYYQSAAASGMSGGTAIPVFLILSSGGPRVVGGLFSSNSDNMPFSFLTQYNTGGSSSNTTAAHATSIVELTGASTGNVATLWDATGPPSRYSVETGSGTWVTG